MKRYEIEVRVSRVITMMNAKIRLHRFLVVRRSAVDDPAYVMCVVGSYTNWREADIAARAEGNMSIYVHHVLDQARERISDVEIA